MNFIELLKTFYYKFKLLETCCQPTDRQTNGPTDKMAYRAAIAAKNIKLTCPNSVEDISESWVKSSLKSTEKISSHLICLGIARSEERSTEYFIAQLQLYCT